MPNTVSSAEQHEALARYYQFHSKIYDATRWSFLFGRNAIIQRLAESQTPKNVLEVGCGTGRNLHQLAQTFSSATITGLDLSPAMLEKSKQATAGFGKRVKLIQRAYDRPIYSTHNGGKRFDLVLFSYALTMFNPGWEAAITAGIGDLAPGGLLAVVDFHDSPLPVFKRWMGVNHVKMDGHLQPLLRDSLVAQIDEVKPAYAGVWNYLMFVGKKAS